uniref:Uncharacterized protein n=1 Tax=Anguilla anguilla TaxID=7936 RepID=A0A0E9PLD6_ANGAN
MSEFSQKVLRLNDYQLGHSHTRMSQAL